MNKPKLFVFEKPSQAKFGSVIMSKGDKAILAQSIAGYKFDYQEIRFKEAPFTKELPRYKRSPYKDYHSNFTSYLYDNEGNKEFSNELDYIYKLKSYSNKIDDFLSQFSEVINACDLNLSGVRAFDFKMKYFFHLGDNWESYIDNSDIVLTTMFLVSYDEMSMKNSMKERVPLIGNEVFNGFKETYIKKDFFEYNYNLNAILFYTQILRELDYKLNKETPVLTKNHIWTLFNIKNNVTINSFKITKAMEYNCIGSSASRYQVLKNLENMNLISRKEKEDFQAYSKYNYSLTKIGENFIEKLHKKINDPHIGTRLDSDLQIGYRTKIKYDDTLSVEEFKNKYEKYLYQVFSKQKRFLRKINK